MLETIFSGNYVFGFLTNRSNNLLHLTHWQYWFWFFFTWFIILYYIIFINFFFKRSQAYNMKISTSFRSHGKWGDFIVCLVPISWCLNILTNSNFILRLVEWQAESSMFALRVRGKQWYWVYKIDITNLQNLRNASKQIGNVSWYSSPVSQNLSQLELLRLQNSFAPQADLWQKANPLAYNGLSSQKNTTTTPPVYPTFNNYSVETINLSSSVTKQPYTLYSTYMLAQKVQITPTNSSNTFSTQYTDFDIRSISGRNKPNTRVHDFSVVSNKVNPFKSFTKNNFFIIKQKRFSYKSIGGSSQINGNFKFTGNIESKKLNKLLFNDFNKNYVFTKRLLRTFKLLVLPVNVNISVITNSFDVIHSWFIPGLGLKLDCVPGRSTHHTLHIINPGFYYGQCAEICGRYHHHMPIRVCALNYTHFVFWWNNRGSHQFFQSHEHIQL